MSKPSRLRAWLRPVARPVRRAQHRLAALAAPLSPKRLRATARWLGGFIAERRRRRQDDRLTVAIDITPFWEPLTGVGWYLYRLIESLADNPEVCLRLYGPSILASPDLPQPLVELPTGPAIDVVLYQVPIHGMSIDGGRIIRTLRRIEPLLIARERNKVLFAPNYFLPRRFAFARATRVAMIHDLAFRKLPWAVQDETRERLEQHLAKTVGESDHVITPSHAVRQELIDEGLLGPERVTAVHHGPGQIATTKPTELPAGLSPGFALHVGTIEPRKNLSFLLELWRNLRTEPLELPHLVLCGRLGWKTEDIRQELDRARGEGWLTHLGYVDEGQLARLYREAGLVVLPTLYEGFGLPAIEALSAGTALLCSDLPVLREVADDAADYAAAGDLDAWEAELRRLLRCADEGTAADAAARCRQRTERAGHFDWRRSGYETLQVWRKALGDSA